MTSGPSLISPHTLLACKIQTINTDVWTWKCDIRSQKRWHLEPTRPECEVGSLDQSKKGLHAKKSPFWGVGRVSSAHIMGCQEIQIISGKVVIPRLGFRFYHSLNGRNDVRMGPKFCSWFTAWSLIHCGIIDFEGHISNLFNVFVTDLHIEYACV